MNADTKQDSSFIRLLSFAGRRKWTLFSSVFLSVISTVFGFIPFVVIYLITIELLDPPIDLSYIGYLAIVMLVASFGRIIFIYFSAVLSHISAFDILFGIKRELIQKIGSLPLGFLNNRTTGGVRKIVTEDVDRIELFLAHHLPDTISAMLLPLFAVLFMFTVDWRMALVALIPLPLAIASMMIMWRETDSHSMKNYFDALEEMNGTIVEYVRGMPVVKIFNQTARTFTRLSESVRKYRTFVIEWTREVAPTYSAFSVCVNLPLLFILPAGIWFYLTGSLTIPQLVLFLILGTGYTSFMMKMAMFSGVWKQITEGISRIDEILDQPELPVGRDPAVPYEYTIAFTDVTFSYSSQPAVSGVSFTVPEGSITALVGPSGSGKSTIAQLIPRFRDVDEGSITIGGIDVREIPSELLMDMVAFVFQDAFLFNETIEENIRMGRSDKSFEDVVAAALTAQADDFICSLPDGYQTIIGSEGTYLSGGEQQRIVLARAIFKDAPIVILDEATAYADPENESRIQQAINSLLKDRTVIMIAHRLSTIAHADQILVLDNGRIHEIGKHTDLILVDGLYARMWQSHTKARSWRFATGGAA